VGVAVAAQSSEGAAGLAKAGDDALAPIAAAVMGQPLDKAIVLAVLTSALASMQATILPTVRTAFSMARVGALPDRFAAVHPAHRTPDRATTAVGLAAVAGYIALVAVSENVLADSVTALGLLIAFYYGITGLACAVYHRSRLGHSIADAVCLGLLPGVGAVIFGYVLVRSLLDLSDPDEAFSGSALGVGAPLWIGIGVTAVGVALMFIQRARDPRFFETPS
jgi:amino acid transporter